MKENYSKHVFLKGIIAFSAIIILSLSSFAQDITFTSPTSSTVWEIGDQVNISVQNNSFGQEVSINLYKNGVSVTYISTEICNNGVNNYSWTVEELTPGSDYEIQIESFSMSTLLATSDQFEIAAASPKITEVSQPTTGYYWQNGTSQYIYWKSWAVSEVDIDYSTDNGSSWNSVVSNHAITTDGTNYYQWDISGITGDNPNSLIRVSSSSDGLINNQSEIFTLSEFPAIRFESPSLGESWEIGSEQTISVNNVTDNTYMNGAQTILYIDGSYNSNITVFYEFSPGLNDFTWNIPTSVTASDNCKLVLYDDMYMEIISESDIFELAAPPPSVTSISFPDVNASWSNGFSYDIIFDTYGLSEVKIEYTTNGTDYVEIVDNVTVSNGENTYNWTVSGITGTNNNSQIRISETGNETNNLSSDLFTLSEHTPIYFVDPNATSVWELGSTQTVRLMANETNYSNMNIALFIDGAFVVNMPQNIMLDDLGQHEYTWNIAAIYTPSTNCVLKLVEFMNTTNVYAVSEVFELAAPPPSVTSISSPDEYAYWSNGNSYDIVFGTYGLSEVKIEYTTNGTDYVEIVDNVTVSNGENTYNWAVSGITGTNANSQIRISETGNETNNLSSDLFTLAEHTPIYFVDPNASDAWVLGSSQTVKLMATVPNGNSMDIALFIDGSFIENIPQSLWLGDPGLHQFTWNISASYTASTNCVLKLVSEYDINDVYAISEVFELTEPPASVLSISAPDEFSYWSNGNSYDIIFDTYELSEVKIEYTTNGTDYSEIEDNVSVSNGENTYNWSVTGIVGTNAESQIRISETGNAANNLSSAEFTLSETPIVEIIYPDASSIWFTDEGNKTWEVVNNSQSYISTSCGLYIDNVLVDDEYDNLSAGNNQLSFNLSSSWASTNCDIRIFDIDGLVAQSETFEIKDAAPTIMSISNPSSGSMWANSQTKDIVFETYMISSVDIEYSTDNGGSWNSIVTSVSAENGENAYPWDISGITGNNPNSLIKVTDAGSTAENTSENFTLLENSLCDVTNPTSATNWIPGTQETVSIMNNSGSELTNIDINVYLDGVFVETIYTGISLVDGNNDLAWDIPFTYEIASNYRIQVIQDSDIEIALSDDFTIAYMNNISVSAELYWIEFDSASDCLNYYSSLPVAHIIPSEFNAKIENFGNQTQDDITLLIELYEDASLVDSYTESVWGEIAAGEMTFVSRFVADIWSFSDYKAGSTYEYVFTVSIPNTDEDPTNNTSTQSLDVTDNRFKMHSDLDHECPMPSTFYPEYEPSFGNTMFFAGADRVDSVKCIISNVYSPASLVMHIYDGAAQLVFQSTTVNINSTNIGDTILFSSDYQITEPGNYFVGIRCVSGEASLASTYTNSEILSKIYFNDGVVYYIQDTRIALDVFVKGVSLVSSVGNTTCSGSEVTLGIAPFYPEKSYQWFYEGSEITGETGQSIYFQNIELSDAGEYSYTIDGEEGADIILTVNESPAIEMINEMDVIEGLNITISPVVTGASGSYYYNWTGGITDSELSLTTQDDETYELLVTDQTNQCTAHDEILIDVQHAHICMVTVDTSLVDKKNLIVWEKPETDVITSFNIYSETSTNVYDVIGSLSYDNDTEYTDWLSSPNAHADKYKITAIDTAGNESILSPYHQTMNLSKIPAGDGFVLLWNKYIDESGMYSPTNYNIYRGTDLNSLTLETSLSGGLSSYNYNISDAVENEYYIVSIELAGTCSGSGAKSIYTSSVSNIDRFIATEDEILNADNFSLYPNPTNGTFQLQLPIVFSSDDLITITTIDGRLVKRIKSNFDYIIEIDLSDQMPGIYFVNVQTINGKFAKKLILN